MNAIYSDTHPQIENLQLELLRNTPAWKKVELLVQLNKTAYSLALSGLRQRYPQAGEAELRRRLADLLLGEELASKVYGGLNFAA
jgi:hypothetical protein